VYLDDRGAELGDQHDGEQRGADHHSVEIDLDRPNAARIYDYWLGGGANLAPDRRLADRMARLEPAVVGMARANRAFLRRVVRHCVAEGVRQFLDLGSGIPTVGNVHEVARAADPRCRVAYVDNDAIAVAHSRHRLRGDPLATVTHDDARDVDAVLAAPTVAGLLDLTEPVALLALMVLQYFPDAPDDPAGLIRRYAARLAPGSVVAVSHLTGEETTADMVGLVTLTYESTTPGRLRTRAEVAALLGPATPVAPGVVPVDAWRPDDPYPRETAAGGVLGAVGRL
jgi:hypothetical protein